MTLSAPPREALSLHYLAMMFRKTGVPITPEDFIKFIVDSTPQNVLHSTSARSKQLAEGSRHPFFTKLHIARSMADR